MINLLLAKQTMRLRSFGLLLLALLFSAQTIRGVENPSFEEGLDNWSWWSRDDSGEATSTERISQHGNRSARIEFAGKEDWAFSSRTKLPTQAGRYLKISTWMKVEAGAPEFSVVAMHGQQILQWNIGSVRAEGARWQQYEVLAETPEGTDHVYLRFTGRGETRAWFDAIDYAWTDAPKQGPAQAKVHGWASEHIHEPLGRAAVALESSDGVYLSWRLLPGDPIDVGFHIYRSLDNQSAERMTHRPITETTDWVDPNVPTGSTVRYWVLRSDALARLDEPADAELTTTGQSRGYVHYPLTEQVNSSVVGVGDLDGDGRYDFVVKHPHSRVDPYAGYWKPSQSPFTLEAVNADGHIMWRHSLGQSIEQGIWYSPFVVADLDGDGCAEIGLKTGEGDPRDADGRVHSGAEYLSILDGKTGQLRTQTEWIPRELFASYNNASRNQLSVAYLDGKTPFLIVERGTYQRIVLDAWQFHKGQLKQVWRWDNQHELRRYWGQGAHILQSVDIDADGRDEIIVGSAVVDDNGDSLWSTGLGHPDHVYIGDHDPERAGLEMYYGLETSQLLGNGMCLVDAASGKIIWGHEGSTRHVHHKGLCADLTAEHPGNELYSCDSDAEKRPERPFLRNAQGELIASEMDWDFGPLSVWWDGDRQRELIQKNTIHKYMGDELASISGKVLGVADLFGDWREEILVAVDGGLRIYSTTIPAKDKRVCLTADSLYRSGLRQFSSGYWQVPLLRDGLK